VLCARLAELGYTVRRSTRNPPAAAGRDDFDTIATGELGAHTDWSQALQGIALVFHLAARTHVLRETARDALPEYRRINVEGTRALAQAALHAGVRRMVFLSSIKVTGERTAGHPFSEDTPPQPEDAYGVSKWEAEQTLCAITHNTNLETVILRPPLVYGPGVKGNFLRLMRWVARGVPLPLASITNRRNLIYVENLVDGIIAAGASPAAAGKTYLAGDSEDVSTPGLIQAIAAALQVHPRLFPCPPALLMAGATALGKREEMRRLTGSLQIDSSKIRNELGWAPRFDLAQGLARTAQWYQKAVIE
jgi:nucleoside-diphosphate-sugar epimerase